MLLIVLAFVVSMLVSYLALARMRDQLATGVQARAERINRRIEESARAEDADPTDVDGGTASEAAGEETPDPQ